MPIRKKSGKLLGGRKRCVCVCVALSGVGTGEGLQVTPSEYEFLPWSTSRALTRWGGGGPPPSPAASQQIQSERRRARPMAAISRRIFFRGTLYSALITGTLEHFCGSKYSDLEVTRKTLVLIHSKYWRQGGGAEGGGRKAFKVMKFCYNLK